MRVIVLSNTFFPFLWTSVTIGSLVRFFWRDVDRVGWGGIGRNSGDEQTQYLISAALIISGLTSILQVSRVKIPFIGITVGTGLVSVMGTSFTFLPVARDAISQVGIAWFITILLLLLLLLLLLEVEKPIYLLWIGQSQTVLSTIS